MRGKVRVEHDDDHFGDVGAVDTPLLSVVDVEGRRPEAVFQSQAAPRKQGEGGK